MKASKPNACVCPVCKKHPMPPRCGAMRSTCPPGPGPGCGCILAGIHAQLTNGENFILEDGDGVVFDKVLNQQGSAVIYDPATGVFTLTQKANYLVNWSIAAEGSQTAPYVRFALQVNGAVNSGLTMPVSVGAGGGSALISAAPGTALRLINNTKDRVRLGPEASITITTISKE